MAVLSYSQWTTTGSPWSAATCIADFTKTMRGHGYTVYILGDVNNHLKANVPEDHTPYSHTPWPGAQPYPRILACDVMPGGSLDWKTLGERLVMDKNAGKPGTEWIKYLNYTDRAGKCWNASWQPHYARRTSTDKGHIHISARTDYVDAHTSYDPITGGGSSGPAAPTGSAVPAWPGRYLKQGSSGTDVAAWQSQMRHRGWTIGVDGQFGPQTHTVCRQFQTEKRLGVDGIIGNDTWRAAWTANVT